MTEHLDLKEFTKRLKSIVDYAMESIQMGIYAGGHVQRQDINAHGVTPGGVEMEVHLETQIIITLLTAAGLESREEEASNG